LIESKNDIYYTYVKIQTMFSNINGKENILKPDSAKQTLSKAVQNSENMVK